MINKMKFLSEKYQTELLESLNSFSKNNLYTEKSVENFGFYLEESFDVFETNEYNQYVKILNKIELLYPQLAIELEEYLTKEINMVSLISFHAGVISAQSR